MMEFNDTLNEDFLKFEYVVHKENWKSILKSIHPSTSAIIRLLFWKKKTSDTTEYDLLQWLATKKYM